MKVIIADDEKWVRLTIISVIPFHQLGLNLAGEAADGLEALDLCKKCMPDILITDIRMPGLSGLELIQELRQLYPNIKIVIISGYSDFEYTKAAIKLGVSDYILKPVSQPEITQVLQRVIDAIKSESLHKEEHKLLKDQFRAAIPLLHDNVLNQLIIPTLLTSDAIRGSLMKCGIKFDLPLYTVVVLSPDDNKVLKTNNDTTRYKTIVRRIIRKYVNGVSFSKPPAGSDIVVIVNHLNNDYSQTLDKALSLCCTLFNRRFGCSLSAGISTPSSQIKKLPDLYIQASESLALRFWEGKGKTFYFDKLKIMENSSFFVSEENLEKIAFGIKFSDIQPSLHCMETAITNFRSRHYIKPDTVKEFFWNFIQSIVNKLNLQVSFVEYVTSFSYIHPYEKVKSAAFLNDLEAYISELLRNICTHYSQRNPESNMNPVENAKRIINENYNNDISLEQVSKYIHLNPTYFSELFKKEVGMSFVDYKTNVRIDNAKRLLQTTDMNIYEISNKIGYSDPKYFSKLFKKITGTTPFGYKEGNNK